MIKEETEAVGIVTEGKIWKILEASSGQRQRGLKKRLRLLEQSLDDKIWQKQSLNDNHKRPNQDKGRED